MSLFKKKEETTDESPDVPDLKQSTPELDEMANLSKHLVQELETVQKHLMETNEKMSKMEADMITLEKAHTTITEMIMKNADQIDSLTQRMNGMGSAVAKIREKLDK